MEAKQLLEVEYNDNFNCIVPLIQHDDKEGLQSTWAVDNVNVKCGQKNGT